ncbi:hypothetical protein [Flavobacterium sp. HNIBRBA15423]|uniref:hypothetical protein n=1 Tax=Flavobacterium sp. HNIBRBA15423 TaxID=3458683 RepID=UPI0040446D00
MIVSTALSYIYNQLQNKKVDWNSISTYLSFQSILILILFSATNWILEIFKWQNLVSFFKKISFLESTKQSLGSLTASIFTPNRIGEYGAKMLYYPKENAKKIVFLNFISNSSQMAVTCFFGILGLIINSSKFDSLSLWISFKIKLLFLILIIVVAFVFLFFVRKHEVYGFSIEKLVSKIKQFPANIMQSNFQLSTMRYLVFSHQFYFLLVLFNCEIDYPTALSTIFIMYFLASLIPSIHFMDVAIKGGVAVYLFSKFGINEWKIIMITSFMWLFNLVIPVLIGSYFVLLFKSQQK